LRPCWKRIVSKRTVETHRQNILDKTGSKNTAALVRHAMAQGYLSDDSIPAASGGVEG
jgi:hypothetical protein